MTNAVDNTSFNSNVNAALLARGITHHMTAEKSESRKTLWIQVRNPADGQRASLILDESEMSELASLLMNPAAGKIVFEY